MWMLNFCGGECTDNIQTHFKATLENTLILNVCSADTILRVQKELRTAKVLKMSKNEELNEFNTNDKLNNLNINILVNIAALVAGKDHDLDFDIHFIPCEKDDSKKEYKCHKAIFHQWLLLESTPFILRIGMKMPMSNINNTIHY